MPVAEKTTEPKPEAPRLQYGWLRQARGSQVSVRLIDGKVLGGMLLDADQYCLALTVAGKAEPVLIFKHAIAFLLKQSGPPT